LQQAAIEQGLIGTLLWPAKLPDAVAPLKMVEVGERSRPSSTVGNQSQANDLQIFQSNLTDRTRQVAQQPPGGRSLLDRVSHPYPGEGVVLSGCR
jgi:hypothetical protein